MTILLLMMLLIFLLCQILLPIGNGVYADEIVPEYSILFDASYSTDLRDNTGGIKRLTLFKQNSKFLIEHVTNEKLFFYYFGGSITNQFRKIDYNDKNDLISKIDLLESSGSPSFSYALEKFSALPETRHSDVILIYFDGLESRNELFVLPDLKKYFRSEQQVIVIGSTQTDNSVLQEQIKSWVVQNNVHFFLADQIEQMYTFITDRTLDSEIEFIAENQEPDDIGLHESEVQAESKITENKIVEGVEIPLQAENSGSGIGAALVVSIILVILTFFILLGIRFKVFSKIPVMFRRVLFNWKRGQKAKPDESIEFDLSLDVYIHGGRKTRHTFHDTVITAGSNEEDLLQLEKPKLRGHKQSSEFTIRIENNRAFFSSPFYVLVNGVNLKHKELHPGDRIIWGKYRIMFHDLVIKRTNKKGKISILTASSVMIFFMSVAALSQVTHISPGESVPDDKVDILFIHAHPDDESIDFGCALATANRKGLKTALVQLTDGNSGIDQYPYRNTEEGYPDYDMEGTQELVKFRINEALNAHRVLGTDYLIRLGLYNNPYSSVIDIQSLEAVLSDWNKTINVKQKLLEIITKLQPEVIIAPDGRSKAREHFEHETTGWIVADVVQTAIANGVDVKGFLYSIDPRQVAVYENTVKIEAMVNIDNKSNARQIQAEALMQHKTQGDATVVSMEILPNFEFEYYGIHFWNDSISPEKYLGPAVE